MFALGFIIVQGCCTINCWRVDDDKTVLLTFSSLQGSFYESHLTEIPVWFAGIIVNNQYSDGRDYMKETDAPSTHTHTHKSSLDGSASPAKFKQAATCFEQTCHAFFFF